MNLCKQCQSPTTNPVFCCRSCSTRHHNSNAGGRVTGKKRLAKECISCGNKFFGRDKKTRCSDCRYGIQNLTKGQAATNDTQRYRRIRSHARIIAKNNKLLNACCVCGYDLYVECAHKQSISSFSDDTPISIINNPGNLTGLCRNHHWEYDHGYFCVI